MFNKQVTKFVVALRPLTGSLAVAAVLLADGAATAFAQIEENTLTGITLPSSSMADSSDAGISVHTNLQILGSGGGITGTPFAVGPPFPGLFYETPASIACLYGIRPSVQGCNPYVVTANPVGGSKVIAIVDAFDDPNAFADLQFFSAQFGLKPITTSTFKVVFAPKGVTTTGATPGSCVGTATQPPSAKGTGWDVEESLDIEWAHAMAPSATIYLVEAQSNSVIDVNCAVTVAGSLVSSLGGGEISMSFGTGEFPAEGNSDPIYTAPNVVYFASSGDAAGVFYPSASPNVVSVGGTSLSRNATTGNFMRESDWQNTGGGVSRFEPRPGYQNGIADIVGTHRGTPDVASDANPATGVWVFDSLTLGRPVWFIVGGTSVSAPTWAGIYNAAGFSNSSSNAALTTLYGLQDRFTDITRGICGRFMSQSATEGWDLCSGLGSPRDLHGETDH